MQNLAVNHCPCGMLAVFEHMSGCCSGNMRGRVCEMNQGRALKRFYRRFFPKPFTLSLLGLWESPVSYYITIM